ncbi:MAG: sulfotransferase, partial [bacterium]
MPDNKKVNRARRQVEHPGYEKNASETDHAIASQIDPSKSLVVSGFWRSGTTWLQEYLAATLQAKTIFEPFHFLVPGSKNLFRFYRILKKPQGFKELFLPYCAARSLQNYPLLMNDFDRALRADLPGPAVRVLRKSVEESRLTRVVVKFTRGQLCLRAAQEAFEMPLIHIYRDPRAVVASMKMTDWFWLFDHLGLQEQLLKVKDGRATVFSVWADAIAEYDGDKIARIAAYWALSEKYLEDSFSDRPDKIAVV